MESSVEGEKDGEAERQDMSVGEVPCLIYVLLNAPATHFLVMVARLSILELQ